MTHYKNLTNYKNIKIIFRNHELQNTKEINDNIYLKTLNELEKGNNVIFLSVETKSLHINLKLVSYLSKIPLKNILRNEFENEFEMKLFLETYEKIVKYNFNKNLNIKEININDNTFELTKELLSNIHNKKEQETLIIVDNLTLMYRNEIKRNDSTYFEYVDSILLKLNELNNDSLAKFLVRVNTPKESYLNSL